ncbi:hypothetical protein [Methanolapillus ohkumae]|uniref:Uncharacterized protein n=1 Tax=Methanolapillus ohkumae TaxID=3028298 RepID=A0AA96ZWB7_9EURY|nr:hypothetical protein MsAm2_01670 [Methanosarcinaceae archaeon Am2]
MNQKKFHGICLLVLLILLILPITAASEQTMETINTYKVSGENATTYGPYIYAGHEYDYTEFSMDGNLSGVLITDSMTGAVVEDENIIRKVSYTNAVLMGFTMETAEIYKTTAQNYKIISTSNADMADLLAAELKLYTTADQNKIGSVDKDFRELSRLYAELSAIYDEAAVTGTDVAHGNKTYENAELMMSQVNRIEAKLKEIKPVYEKTAAGMNVYYDVLIEGPYQVNKTQMQTAKTNYNYIVKQELSNFDYVIKTLENSANTVKARPDLDVELSKLRIKINDMPGFGFLPAVVIVGLFAFVLGRKSKKN